MQAAYWRVALDVLATLEASALEEAGAHCRCFLEVVLGRLSFLAMACAGPAGILA
jgi:hypothetical protein